MSDNQQQLLNHRTTEQNDAIVLQNMNPSGAVGATGTAALPSESRYVL